MKWSWKIARVRDIDIYIHATFLLILGWVAFNYWVESHRWSAVLGGVLFILALFFCVILHELGHALTARRFGIRTRDITLYPIGGVARLERLPERPLEELWVALAGPAVNVGIAAALLAYLFLSRDLSSLRFSVTSGDAVARLLWVNLSLALFNLLPAFPMDGGRVLRALLAMRIDHVHATQIAANVGQGMALLFGLVGLLVDPFLLFVALFVWIGATQEASMVQMRNSLGGIPVFRAMQTQYETLSPHDRLERVIELILAGSQHDFPVVEDERVLGILDRETFIKALTERGQGALVSEVMRRGLPEVDTHEMVASALERLDESRAKALPVTHDGRLIGLITLENITEFLMIRSALRASKVAA